jgi:hypothetical protein
MASKINRTPRPRKRMNELHPIHPNSDLARWIASHGWVPFTVEEALAEFGLQLRMCTN